MTPGGQAGGSDDDAGRRGAGAGSQGRRDRDRGPPAVSATAAGATTGVKSAAPTFTTKLVTPNGPHGSLTRTFTTFCPGSGARRGRRPRRRPSGPAEGASTGIEVGVT